jgi:xylose isomerase
MDPIRAVEKLAEIGAYGINFHDDDVVPFGASDSERDKILDAFRKVLADTGLVVTTATTNLFTHPVFKDGAFTSNNRDVRRYAIKKVMRNIDLAAELGAKIYVAWGGREGAESGASKDIAAALDRYQEAFNLLGEFVTDRGYDIRFAIEPKPNEPRGDIILPTAGHAMAFIETLDRPELVGINPEIGHEEMAGLNAAAGYAQALWQGKLFHIDLNAQRPGKYDQDFRFGSEGIRDAFYLVKLLEDAGYDGMRHFDAHPYRTEDAEGVWDFARGNIRTYLILREKARRFHADPEIQAALAEAKVAEISVPTRPDGGLAALRSDRPDPIALAQPGLGLERLDQLVTELLLGVR